MAGKSYPLSVLLTAIDRISGPMRRVQATIDRVTAPARQVSNALSSIGKEAGIDRLKASLGGVRDNVMGVGAALQTAARRFTVVTGAGLGLAYLFKREFIDSADSMERMRISLIGIEGSSAKARAAMAFLTDLTVKTPFELPDLAAAFRTLRGQGVDEIEPTIRAIVEQVAKLGGRGEDLTGIAMQLGQAWGKGRLMAQDANILVERGVPVWGMLQRAVARVNKGQLISVATLRKMSEEGQLGTKVIRALIEQMGLESQGASARMMTSWSGLISNLADQWLFFKDRVMSSGPLEALKTRVQGILAVIDRMDKSGELQVLINAFGTRLVAAIDAVWQALPQIWTALQELGGWVKWIADLCGGWGNLLKFGLAAYIGGPLVVAIGSLIASIGSLGLAIGFTPIGWFLAGLAAIAAAGYFIVKHWETVGPFFRGLFEGIRAYLGGFLDFFSGNFVDGITGILRGAVQVWSTLLGPIFSLFKWGITGGAYRLLVPQVFRQPATVSSGGPTVGPAPVLPGLGLARSSQAPAEAKVTVDFTNVPRGTRIRPAADNAVPLKLGMGFALMESH